MSVCLSVCLSVRYTFESRMVKYNEAFHKYSIHQEEGERRLFFAKKCYNPNGLSVHVYIVTSGHASYKSR